MVNSLFESVQSQSNGPVNLDLTKIWWTYAIQGVLYLFYLDGPRATKGEPHKCELSEFYSKLVLRRALPIYMHVCNLILGFLRETCIL